MRGRWYENYIEKTNGSDVKCVDISVKMFTFTDGEEQIKLDSALEAFCVSGDTIVIEHEIRSSVDFMRLVMVKDAIDSIRPFNAEVILVMLYVPYARQDRICEPGESLALRKFADILNPRNGLAVVFRDGKLERFQTIDAIRENVQEALVKYL